MSMTGQLTFIMMIMMIMMIIIMIMIVTIRMVIINDDIILGPIVS